MRSQIRTYRLDEQIETMLGQFRKEDPNIKCPFGKKVTRLCTNSQCNNALRCGDNRCKNCGKDVHLGCLSIPLSQLTDLINQKSESCRQVLKNVIQIDNQIIDSLRRSHRHFIGKYMAGYQSKQLKQWINKIYTNKSYNALTGQQAMELSKKLQLKTIMKNEKVEDTLYQQYRGKIQDIVSLIKQLQRSVFFQISIDSQILQMKKSNEKDIKFITQSLNHPTTIQLIFRASEHNFKAKAFHEHCDNINDTFVLMRTQFGKVIGGYSHYKWNDQRQQQDGSVRDPARKTFLMQLDLYQKYTSAREDFLITCRQDWGPIFGQGFDLAIADQCNQNNNSYAKFPYSYSGCEYKLYGNNQYSYRNLIGATNGSNAFKVVQYEVYRVVWE